MPITPQCLAKSKRFSSDYQPEKNGAPKGPRLTTILSKLLTTKIMSCDKEVEMAIKEAGIKKTKGAALMLRYVYNGLEGDTKAIEGILDRLDGKVIQKILGNEGASQIVYVINNGNTKRREGNRINLLSASKPADNQG